MKARTVIFLLSILTLGQSMATDALPLPTWRGHEKKELIKEGWLAGAQILANEPTPGELKPEAIPLLQVEKPNTEDLMQNIVVLHEIPEKFLDAYFEKRPDSFLVDPQGLLNPASLHDSLAFLNYHSGDSSIDIFTYVISGDQEIPSEVRVEETSERFFSSGKPALIVFYYLGAPQRSTIYLSPSLTTAILPPEQRHALASSVTQAVEKGDPFEQLSAFLVQMSIRVYWMERVIKGSNAVTVPIALPSDAPAVVENEGAKRNSKIELIREIAIKYAMPTAAILSVLLTAFILNFWLRRRKRFRFPEFDVEPRLGGSHAAGVGAVISFARSAVPPARQRDQMPDYLRRA